MTEEVANVTWAERSARLATLRPVRSLGRFAIPLLMAYLAIWAAGSEVLPFLVIKGGAQYAAWSYAAGQNQMTWFNTGFARRELQGTLQALLPFGPMVATAVFHLIAYTALVSAAVWLVAKRRAGLQTMAFAAVFAAVLIRIGLDVGRSDPVVMLLGLLAVWAVRNARWAIAAAALSVALAFHESGLIILGPLCVAAAWENATWRSWRTRSMLAGALIIAAGLCLYLISARTHLDPVALDRQIRPQFMSPTLPDIAIYWASTGAKGLRVAQCQAMIDPNYLINVASGCALITFVCFLLRPQRWRSTLAATLLPFLALDSIAIDVGRWAVFAVFGIVALSAGDLEQPSVSRLRACLALLVLPLVAGPVGWRWFASPVPIVDFVAQNLNYQSLGPVPGMYECDPNWRRYLGLGHG